MSDHADDSARPAKRARLDDNAPTLSFAPAPQPDTDLEREVRAGITEYVCPDNLGFTGVLKQRYTDFLVNEIGLDGRVLRLRSMAVPKRENGGEGKKEKANGGAAKQEAKEKVAVVVEEETGDVTMVDAQTEAVKTEDAPVKNDTVSKAESAQKPEAKEEEAKKDLEPEPEPEPELAEEDRNTLHDIFGEDTTNEIVKLVGQVRKRESRKARDFKIIITPPITEKEKRTQAHQSLRRMFPNMLESSMEENQSLRIKATPPAERKGRGKKGGGRDGGPSRNKGGQGWEELGGEYLHFNLYKENKDTMEVVGFLGSKLNSGAKAFGFAGTKDRRACTVQRVCVKRQTAERMYNFNKVLYNSVMGDWEYSPNNLTLGDLKGNEFTITLRNCHFQGEEGMNFVQRRMLADSVISKAIADFSEKGFINYYGLQRFGSFAASTDAIGCKMLQDDLAGAVADILAYSDVALAAANDTLPADSTILVSQDDRNRAKALHSFHTAGKNSIALEILPRKFTAERNIIQHLTSRNSRTGAYDRTADWQGALMTVPRTLRLMYVHAYQSLVWNVVAGHRWTLHGDKVIAGDLVLVSEHRDKEAAAKPTQKPRDIDDSGEVVINPTGSENANAGAMEFERARALTQDDVDSGAYTILDVVLPQPGYDVEYPANEIGEFYKTFMASEKGGCLDPLNMRRGWREVSLSGGYRKFLARPLAPLSYEVRAYVAEDAQFVATDLQELIAAGGAKDANVRVDAAQLIEGDQEGDEAEMKLAVVLKLQLASSQYATMALRELMKAGGVKAFKPEFMGGR